jgi:hypothetical protein
MNHAYCHDVPRALATGGSRRHTLTRLAALLAVGLLAAVGLGSAQTTVGEDPLTTTGLTVSELEEFMRARPGQAICAQEKPPYEDCFLGFCSLECPAGILAVAGCWAQAHSQGRPMCGALGFCNHDPEAACETNADCGPQEFCGVTCCPVANQCITRCPEDNQ